MRFFLSNSFLFLVVQLCTWIRPSEEAFLRSTPIEKSVASVSPSFLGRHNRDPLPISSTSHTVASGRGFGVVSAVASTAVLDQTEEEISAVDDGRHEESVEKILEQFGSKSEKRANVILPTGWGKTLLSLQVLRRMALATEKKGRKGKAKQQPAIRTALYVTPFLKLADQTLDKLERFKILQGVPYKCLIVASDTVRSEPHTTCPEIIASFLMEAQEENAGLRLLVSTKKSLPRVAEALDLIRKSSQDTKSKKDMHKLGLAIFDEAHDYTGIGKFSGFGLLDEELPIEYRLFQTATPRFYNATVQQTTVVGAFMSEETGARQLFYESNKKDRRNRPIITRDDARSFDNTTLFGPTVEKKTYRDGIQKGVTVPLTLCVVSKKELKQLVGAEDDDDFDKVWTPEELRPLVLKAALDKWNVSHAVSFHSNIERSRRFIEYAQNRSIWDKEVFAAHVSSRIRRTEQEEILYQAKKASKSVVFNCRILCTGVDETRWDMVYLADAMTSQEQIIQAIGRASRPSPNKQRGYILLPIVYDEEEADAASSLAQTSSTGYLMLSRTFQAMFEDDPEIRRAVVLVKSEEAKLGRPLLPSEYPDALRKAIELPDCISLDVQNKVMQHLVTGVRDIRDAWEDMFLRVSDFKKKYPWEPLPEAESRWLAHQRDHMKRGYLAIERMQRLEGIGVKWSAVEETRDRYLEYLRRYKDREGHCLVPANHREGNLPLGDWICRQRHIRTRGELDVDVERKLDEIGMVWSWQDDAWEQNVAALQRHLERGGGWDTLAEAPEGSKLSCWVYRTRHSRRNGKLEDFKVEQLDALGITWDVYSQMWETGYQALLSYRAREGDCMVPRAHKEGSVRLGSWVDRQREQKKKGKLGNDQIRRLEKVGFMWTFNGAKWEDNFEALRLFAEKHGHFRNPPKNVGKNNVNLCKWLTNQRQREKKGTLSESRRRLLQDIGALS